MLPLVFAAGCCLGSLWPGHAGQLFGIGGLAGVWACFLVASEDPLTWLVPTLVGGVPILWFLGRLLDRLQAELWVWLASCCVVTLVAGYLLLQGYADFDSALAYHGSLLAYGVCAVQLGSYGATLLALVFGAGRSAAK